MQQDAQFAPHRRPSFSLRPTLPSDDDMLLRLEALLSGHFRNGRELSSGGARSLARLLLTGRDAAWRAVWPDARCLAIEVDGTPVGRLWFDASGDQWTLLDLALLPSHRGRGLGLAALREWLQTADDAGVPVGCRVRMDNPFILQLRCVGFVEGERRRGQMLVVRPVSAGCAWEWDEPTMPLAA